MLGEGFKGGVFAVSSLTPEAGSAPQAGAHKERACLPSAPMLALCPAPFVLSVVNGGDNRGLASVTPWTDLGAG